MHFSKIYIQDNFVPDYATDPYRRKVIGIEITLNDDDKIEQAKELAEQYVKEYILANKVDSPHIIERYIPEEQLPIIRYD